MAQSLTKIVELLSKREISTEMKEMLDRMNKTKRKVEKNRKTSSAVKSITITSGI